MQQGLGWPLPADVEDAPLERLLFKQTALRAGYATPDLAHLHQEIKRWGVTLQLL